MEIHLEDATGNAHRVTIERDGDGFRASIDGGPTRRVTLAHRRGAEMRLRIGGGTPQDILVTRDPAGKRLVQAGALPPAAFEGVPARKARAKAQHGGPEPLRASMHAQVTAVHVQAGDRVERGKALVSLEAMKMEMRLAAPHAGTVLRVHVKVGEVVERGKVLVEIEE